MCVFIAFAAYVRNKQHNIWLDTGIQL